MTTPFRYRFRVRYAECDAQKVVFNARFGDYIDLAVLEFLRALRSATDTSLRARTLPTSLRNWLRLSFSETVREPSENHQ